MRIAIRADASAKIGLGHVMRCLTLARGWQAQGATIHFLCADLPVSLAKWIEAQGHTVHSLPPPEGPQAEPADARSCLPLLESFRPHWLVLDHYQLGQTWENHLAHCVGKIMVIDDLANRSHQADLLLDQTLARTAEAYLPRVNSTTTLCLGSAFALLRPSFAAQRSASLAYRKAAGCRLTHIFVSLGGTDPGNLSAEILKALSSVPISSEISVTVALSAQAPHTETLQTLIKQLGLNAHILLGETDLSSHMVGADLAIGAAGSSAWERCCLGLPTLMLVTADNQREVAAALEKAGAARLIPSDATLQANLLDALLDLVQHPEKLASLSHKAAQQIDGLGLDRTMAAMTETWVRPPPSSGQLRPLMEEDLALVLAWRNHPDIRCRMRNSSLISYQAHREWFKKTHSSPGHTLMIYKEADRLRGFMQFTELPGGAAEWGFYAAPEAPPGTGRRLCQQALDRAFFDLGLKQIRAEVLADNPRSLHLHRSLGFRQTDTSRVTSPVPQHFVMDAATWAAERKIPCPPLLSP